VSAAVHAGAASRGPVSESDNSSSLESSDSSSLANNVHVTRSSSSSSFTSSSFTSSDDTPSVAERPAVKKGGGKKVKTSQKRNLTAEAKRPSSSDSKGKSVVPSGKLPIVHRIDSKHSLRKALVTAHERYGHVSPKKLVYFKKKGRIHSSNIPVRGALDFKVKDGLVCAVMKRNRPKKTAFLHVEDKRQWKLWEKVFSDSLSKRNVKSFPGNHH